MILRRAIYAVLSSVLLLCLFIISIAQIHSFRQWALSFAENAINAELTGKISISDIEFNWINGIHLHNVTLFAANDTLASISRISIEYDAAALLDNSINISELTIYDASVKLLRDGGGVWNYNLFVKPNTDASARKPFDWPIHIRTLALSNSALTIFDSTSAAAADSIMDFSHAFFQNLNIRLSAGANLAESSFHARIRNAEFKENRTSFYVNSLRFIALANKSEIKLRDFYLRTANSNVSGSINIEGNIFERPSDSSIATMPLSVTLDADSIATKDIRYFLPYMGVTGTYKLKLEALGTLQEMTVRTLHISSPLSFANIQARVLNLHKSNNLRILTTIRESLINYDEFQKATPALYLPKLNFLGNVQLKNVKADIVPSDSLAFDLLASTKSGDVSGHLTLYPARDTLAYWLNVTTANLNIGKIAQNPDLNGSINGRVTMNGQGTMLKDLHSSANVQLNRSRIGNRTIKSFLFNGSADRGGIISIDTMRIDIADTLNEDFAGKNDGIATVHGTLNLRSPRRPIYDIAAACEMFPIHTAAGFSYPLTLDGDFRLAGEGFHPDSLNTAFEGNFRAVHMKDRSLLNLPIYATVKPLGKNSRHILFTSRPIDLDIQGRFTFSSLIHTLEHQTSAIVKFADKKISSISGRSQNKEIKTISQSNFNDTLQLRFQADIRDFSPITLYFKAGTILSSGWLRGGIDVDGTNASLSLDTITISTLNVNNPEIHLISDTIRGALQLHCAQHDDAQISVEYINGNLQWDSSFALNSMKFTKPIIGLHYENHNLSYSISGSYEDLLRVSAQGTATDLDSLLDFNISQLETDYRGMKWSSSGNVQGSISPLGFKIDEMRMNRQQAETIDVSGIFSSVSMKNAKIDIVHFPLEDIQTIPDIPLDIKDILHSLQGNLDSMTFTAEGNLTNPKLTLKGNFTDVSYNNILIGNQSINFNHADSNISGNIVVVNPKFLTESKTLTAEVKQLPLNLAFATVKQRLSATKPIIVSALAKRLSVAVFAPFIPGVKKVQGLADADIYINGTPGNINYGGRAVIYGASMVTLSTNLQYFADGVFSLKNNTIKIDEFRLRNQPGDLRGGVANVNGRIIIDGFSIDSLDLYITSPGIMLMSDASVATMPIMYGKFIAATPDTSIHFFGKLNKPFLRGGLSIKAAEIVMPPDKKIQANVSRFRYIIDTTRNKIKIAEKNVNSAKNYAQADANNSYTAATVKTSASTEPDAHKERITPSIVDKTDFDLTIKSPHRISLRMLLAEFEEIRAEILPLDQRKTLRYLYNPQDGQRQIYGDLTLSPNSEYQFLKVFGTSGNLSFIDGEISNPTLNLIATYNGRTSGSDAKQFKVTLKITGTKKIPRVVMSYELDGIEAVGDSSKIRGDALTLLMAGRTQDQLFAKSSGGFNAANELSTSLSAAVSQLFSGLLEGTGFIQSASINFDGGVQDMSQARLNLSGQLFGDVAWRVGGTLNDISNNTEFSVDVPLNSIADLNILRNIMLQLTRSANPNAAASLIRRQKEWEIKLGFRYLF